MSIPLDRDKRICEIGSVFDVDVVWCLFFFSSRRRHTRLQGDWSSDVCSSDLDKAKGAALKAFLQYIYGDGQTMAAEINYAKLPDSLKEKGLAQVDKLVIPG